MKRVTYIAFNLFVNLFRILPFRVMYTVSDLFYLLIRVVGYRNSVVTDNLQRSFPDKSEQEIKEIKCKFYHHFCDMLVEEMKGHSMSVEEAEKRYKIADTALFDKYYAENRTVICLVGHYGNWEWATIGLKNQLKQQLAGFYRPIKNKLIDDAIKEQRRQCGMEICPIDRTPYLFREFKSKNGVIFMIADQANPNHKRRIWVNFLNQETSCLQGAEVYAKMFNIPVVYAEVMPLRRGYYECRIKSITDDPTSTPDGYITKRYFDELALTINKAPEYWMWSHRRWKHKRHESEAYKPTY